MFETIHFFYLLLPSYFILNYLYSIFIIKNLRRESLKKAFTIILMIAFILSISVASEQSIRVDASDIMYIEAATGIIQLGLTECQILSPHWVPVNYYTGNVRFFPYTIQESIDNNEIALIFHQYPTMDDQFNRSELDKYPQLKRTEKYIIIANEDITNKTCKRTTGYSNPMTSEPCNALSEKFHSPFMSTTFLKTCRAINYLSF